MPDQRTAGAATQGIIYYNNNNNNIVTGVNSVPALQHRARVCGHFLLRSQRGSGAGGSVRLQSVPTAPDTLPDWRQWRTAIQTNGNNFSIVVFCGTKN